MIAAPGTRPPKPRPLGTAEGLGDRMRSAAFAEFQAAAAFAWAAETFAEAPRALREAWRNQIPQEQMHFDLIVARMAEMGFRLDERPVSRGLWDSLMACVSGLEFCVKIASAEERGRRAGLRLSEYLAADDPVTTAIFRRIAEDEVAHVALAATYCGWTPAD